MYRIYVESQDRYFYAPIKSGYFSIHYTTKTFINDIIFIGDNPYTDGNVTYFKTKREARIWINRFKHQILNYAAKRNIKDFTFDIS